MADELTEVSTAEKIKLVNDDDVRKKGQIIIASILIASAIAYLFYYAIFLGDADFRLGLANDMRVMVIMGVGAGLAIFGLGRTVGKR